MARLVYQPNIALYYYMKLFSKNLKLDILSLIYESFVSADGKITTRTGGCLRWTGHYCSDGGHHYTTPPPPPTVLARTEFRRTSHPGPEPHRPGGMSQIRARKPKPNWPIV